MSGIDDGVAVISDCALSPNPSPRTFFSSLLGEDASSRSFLDPPADAGIDGHLKGMTELSPQDNACESRAASGCLLEAGNAFSGQKTSFCGGLSERMAARAGFNAPRLNTTRIRSSNMFASSSQEVRSPYLTIPPGLSPTSLLESPVFISNSLAQQSPTTGKFPINNRSSMEISAIPDKDKDMLKDADSKSFLFKHHGTSCFPTASKVNAFANYSQSPVQSGVAFPAQIQDDADLVSKNQQNFLSPLVNVTKLAGAKDDTDNTSCDAKHHQLSDKKDEEDKKEPPSSMSSAGTQSEDGYNWRKYGQKQVKGSEYPRSYYKCTHPNCQVKKKVERSYDGNIIDIICKGAHNHPKPPPNRRTVIGSSYLAGEMDSTGQNSADAGLDGEPSWENSRHGVTTPMSILWRHDDVETASSASAANESLDPPASSLMQNIFHFDVTNDVDVSSTISNNDNEDDQETHDEVPLVYEEEDDESESKRRKVDASLMDIAGATRAIREPRVVVQTTSEVDILDDGYRWRKYGQKVVKGNPNPRSYYKCTHPGCTVRKHVERASHDLKSVITTYEGKHNHDVPAARSSSHISSGPSSSGTSTAAALAPVQSESAKARDILPGFNDFASLNPLGLQRMQSLQPKTSISYGVNQPGLANLMTSGFGPGQQRLPVLPFLHSGLGQQQQQQEVDEMGFIMPKRELEEPISESNPAISDGSLYYQQIIGRLHLGQ